MECPDLSVSEVELESRLEGRKVGMAAAFSCPTGFNLQGPKRITCQKNGERECHHECFIFCVKCRGGVCREFEI